jgi:hypothetical protein
MAELVRGGARVASDVQTVGAVERAGAGAGVADEPGRRRIAKERTNNSVTVGAQRRDTGP